MVNPTKEKEVVNSRSVDEKGDYIFRFTIDSPQETADEPLVDFVRCQLADLLQIVVLTYNGKRVRVNGFLLLDNSEREHKIWVEK
ncbi:MAG: hypothetical protein PVF58_10445 [Candidatus Methanofastidiosia archaeon]|jgi:hypothetical protein